MNIIKKRNVENAMSKLNKKIHIDRENALDKSLVNKSDYKIINKDIINLEKPLKKIIKTWKKKEKII